MRSKLGKALSFLVEQSVTLLAIIGSATIVVGNELQILDIKGDRLSLAILSLVGLLATASLVERLGALRRLEKSTEGIHDFIVSQDVRPSLDSVVTDRKSSQPPLETRFISASEINITGGSLLRLSTEYLGYFDRKAREGCKIRFLLLDPDCEAARLVAKYVVYELSDHDVYLDQIRTSLANLGRLSQRHDGVEVRTYERVPPFSLLMIDPNRDHGSIYVELYAHSVPIRDRPQFVVTPSREPRWYSFFVAQFRIMWNDASLWEPSDEVADANPSQPLGE